MATSSMAAPSFETALTRLLRMRAERDRARD
jgi:hypothetical protein